MLIENAQLKERLFINPKLMLLLLEESNKFD
jgi:hypothetical protein